MHRQVQLAPIYQVHFRDILHDPVYRVVWRGSLHLEHVGGLFCQESIAAMQDHNELKSAIISLADDSVLGNDQQCVFWVPVQWRALSNCSGQDSTRSSQRE
jgi:hypothetical protein